MTGRETLSTDTTKETVNKSYGSVDVRLKLVFLVVVEVMWDAGGGC